MAKAKRKTFKKQPKVKKPLYILRLYIAGPTPRSLFALNNLEMICEKHLHGLYKIEVIDLLKKPQLAKGHQIIAVPTLVKILPAPVKKILGDLTNVEKALVGLDLRILSYDRTGL